MKTILMLGGGFLQCFVIRRAKTLGYRVLVLDADPNALGFAIADAYEVINIVDEDACLKYAQDHKVNGILTAATDFSVLTMSKIAESMHLPGINYQAAKRIKNKAAVRKCLFDAKADDTGYSFEIDSLEQIPQILPQVKFPVMMKPCDGSGSRGTTRVDKAIDFEKACKFAMGGSITHRAVAEPFVDGKEYGVESFVDNGKIHILGIMQKEMTLPPYYAELGHAIPSGLPSVVEDKIRNCVKKALVALDVNHGSVNMDLLLGADGGVHIVDIGARMGGNLIGSHIIPIGTGIAYMDNMIRAAVGDATCFTPISTPFPVASKLLALTPGKVKSLPNFESISKEYGVIIEHHLHIGDEITPYRTNLDGCGYVVAIANNVDDAIVKAQIVKDVIDKQIVREA